MSYERKRRDRLYVIAEILTIAKESALKTQIMYRANLSFGQMYEYIDFLLDIGLLKKVGESYRTTKKGIRYLELHTQLISILEKDKASNQK